MKKKKKKLPVSNWNVLDQSTRSDVFRAKYEQGDSCSQLVWGQAFTEHPSCDLYTKKHTQTPRNTLRIA